MANNKGKKPRIPTPNRSLPLNQNQFARATEQFQDFMYTAVEDIQELHKRTQVLDKALAAVNFVSIRNHFVGLRIMDELLNPAKRPALQGITLGDGTVASNEYNIEARRQQLEAEWHVIHALQNFGRNQRAETLGVRAKVLQEELKQLLEASNGEETEAVMAKADELRTALMATNEA